jgi:glycerol uptake facilitator-like aquaporin
MTEPSLLQRAVAEAVGTALLLATVIGSAIMGEQLADGNMALVLLANSLATGAILVVLILIFGSISGAHFNPAVSLTFLFRGELERRAIFPYLTAQVIGAIVGVMIAHLMFDRAATVVSTIPRLGPGQWLGEIVATFGLVATILGCQRARPEATAYAVGLFITAAYWFTSSTSFANPAVTIARTLTDSVAGIRAIDMPLFVVMQLIGAALAGLLFAWLALGKRARDPALEKN